jgi:hypothetical protein
MFRDANFKPGIRPKASLLLKERIKKKKKRREKKERNKVKAMRRIAFCINGN